MKKFITVIALVSFIGIFSACEEEEIVPQDQLQTEKNVGQGSASEDPNQWD